MASKRYSKEQFIEAVKTSFSYSEVCRHLGISPKGGNLFLVKKKILDYKLDMSHFTGARWNKGKTASEHPSIKKKAIQEILIENSGWSSHMLKLRLFKDGIKQRICERCRNTQWEGQPIPLELHHLNGVHNDNRLENLQILCPNCHVLTENYSGKSSQVLSAQDKSPEVELG